MKLHAYYSQFPATKNADPQYDLLDGDVTWGDTHDWHWYIEGGHPRAAELADEQYAALCHIDGLAAARVIVTVPDEIAATYGAWVNSGESDDENPFAQFIDDVEWEHVWQHPAVELVRENKEHAVWRVSHTARMARIRDGKTLEAALEQAA